MDECIIWRGTTHKAGYGKITLGKQTLLTNRVSYALFNGTLKKDFVVMHTCNNKLCINPKHLAQGTVKENVRQALEDGLWKTVKTKRDTCKYGHYKNDENSYFYGTKGYRMCRICRDSNTRKRAELRRIARLESKFVIGE